MIGILVFHAGTKLDESGNLVSDGGRVLNIVAEGSTIEGIKFFGMARGFLQV